MSQFSGRTFMKKLLGILVLGLLWCNRTLAECFVDGKSLSSFLIRSGYAFAYRKYSTKFNEDEEFAINNKLGLRFMKFQYPWDFRKGHKKTHFSYVNNVPRNFFKV